MSVPVLVADDEPLLREALALQLAEAWPEAQVVASARNGREALELFERHQPSVCFLDVQMPGMSGVEVARRIGARAHIVFVTAYDRYAVEAFAAGVLDYLVKPVARERLAMTVARLRERLAGSVASSATEALLAQLSARLERPAAATLRWIRSTVGSTTRLIAVDVPEQLGAAAQPQRPRDPAAHGRVGRVGGAATRDRLADPAGAEIDRHRAAIVERAGDAGAVHDLSGQDEQRHGHQREHVDLAEDALRHDGQVVRVAAGDEGQHRRGTQRVCDGSACAQQRQHRGQDEPGHRGTIAVGGSRGRPLRRGEPAGAGRDLGALTGACRRLSPDWTMNPRPLRRWSGKWRDNRSMGVEIC